jgi:CBS domain-containing protein
MLVAVIRRAGVGVQEDGMAVKHLIRKPPLTLGPEETVAQAARAMVLHGVGAASIVDASAVVGVVTERDILQKVVATGIDPGTTQVRTIMSSPAFSVSERTSVSAAGELMRKHHIRHLVVLDEKGKQIGMLALRYVLYDIMDELARKVGDLESFIMTDGPGG